MFPYRADVAMRRMPIANWAIIGLTVLVSLVAMFLPNAQTREMFAVWRGDVYEYVTKERPHITVRYTVGEVSAEEAERLREEAEEATSTTDMDDNKRLAAEIAEAISLKSGVRRFHLYQLFTHPFFHAGLLHLAGNMLFLWVFGNAVNAKIGHGPYLGLYGVFAVAAGLAWYLMPGNGLLMLGASGAVMGVAGMFAVLYPLNEISMVFFLLWRPITFQLSAMWVLLGYLVLDILGLLSPGGVVANVSHLAGTLVGAGMAAVLVMAALVRPGAGEKTLLEMLGIKVKREPGSEPRPVIRPQKAASLYAQPDKTEKILKQRAAEEAPLELSGEPLSEEEPLREEEPQRSVDDLPPIELEPFDDDEPPRRISLDE